MGAISDKYNGMIVMLVPIPTPIINRPNMRTLTSFAKVMVNVAITNSRSLHKMTGLRPNLSPRGPVINAPTNAPRRARDTINSFWDVVIEGQVSVK